MRAKPAQIAVAATYAHAITSHHLFRPETNKPGGSALFKAAPGSTRAFAIEAQWPQDQAPEPHRLALKPRTQPCLFSASPLQLRLPAC
jgi:hypothetical protein